MYIFITENVDKKIKTNQLYWLDLGMKLFLVRGKLNANKSFLLAAVSK
jgi:hypothetical protein